MNGESINRFARPALAALWVQVAALLGYMVYGLTQHSSWLSVLDDVLALACMVAWVPLLERYLHGKPVSETAPALQTLRNLFPVLALFRALQWLMLSLAILDGLLADSTNPVSLVALFTVWGAAIVARAAVYAVSCIQFLNPTSRGRNHLLSWLNLLAALELALMVFNVWPPLGFGDRPTELQKGIYGLLGVVEVVSFLLAYRAVEEKQVAGE